MPKKKTTRAKPKPPKVKPRTRGNLVQDRVTGNWSHVGKRKHKTVTPEKPNDGSVPES